MSWYGPPFPGATVVPANCSGILLLLHLQQSVQFRIFLCGCGCMDRLPHRRVVVVAPAQIVANRGNAKPPGAVLSLTRICPGFVPPTEKPMKRSVSQRAKSLWSNATNKVVTKLREEHPRTLTWHHPLVVAA